MNENPVGMQIQRETYLLQYSILLILNKQAGNNLNNKSGKDTIHHVVIVNLVYRSKRNQTCHDKSVRKSAAMLSSNGWKVKADVRGYRRPNSICVDHQCRRPDIIAKKGRVTRIIEWETPDSFNKDRKQHSVFRKYARRHKNIHSSVKICDI